MLDPTNEQSPTENNMKFSCCRLKCHNYYVCVNCYRLCHGSCLMRDKKSYRRLDTNKIVCCNSSTTSITTHELEELKENVKKQHEENDMLHNYKSRLEKRLTDTQNAAMEMEEQLLSMIDELKRANNVNKKAIQNLKTQIVDYEKKPPNRDTGTQTIQLMSNKLVQTKSIPLTPNRAENIRIGKNSFKKIRLFSDEFGKGLRNKIESFMPDYTTYAEIRPNANFMQITKNIYTTTADMDKQDFVFVMAGVNDVTKTPVNEFGKQLNKLMKGTSHTNVLVSTIPHSRWDMEHDKAIQMYNDLIWVTVTKYDHAMLFHFPKLEDAFYTSNGVFLNYEGKLRLAKNIACLCSGTMNIPIEKIKTNKKFEQTNILSRASPVLIEIPILAMEDKNVNKKQTTMALNTSSLLHVNIQSLRNKTGELELLIKQEGVSPNYIALTEHWLQPHEERSIHIPGYKLASCYHRSQNRCGGSAIYTRQHLDTLELTHLKQKSVELTIEISAVEVKSNNIIIITIYRPPSGNEKAFFEIFSSVLTSIQNKFKKNKICICGDFNIDLHRDNKTTQEFREILMSFNLKPTIFGSTRITENSSSLIDNIFINSFEYMVSTNLQTNLSDHMAQILTFSVNRKEPQEVIYRRSFNSKNLDNAYTALRDLDWVGLYEKTDVDEAYELFHGILKKILERNFPLKLVKTSNINNSWITQEIIARGEEIKDLWDQSKIGLITKEEYNGHKRDLREMIKKAKQVFNDNYINQSTNKIKAAWALTNKIINNTEKPKNIILDDLRKGNKSDVETLNSMNESFINICPETYLLNNNEQHINNLTSSIYLKPVTPQDIISIIGSLNNSKSVGEDELPAILYKHLNDLLAAPLAHIVNLSFQSGTFPYRLKKTIIKPIFKKGDKKLITNYRPIALLPVASKIFEKAILIQLTEHISRNNVITSSQHGFLRGHSTQSAVVDYISYILDNLNSRYQTAGVHVDLTKAFDSVDYGVLLHKLELYGIRGLPLKLITSYLSKRQQKVIAEGINKEIISSDWATVKRGVPQGSILGPYLFILYINDLPDSIPMPLTIYADDTAVVLRSNEKKGLEEKIMDTLADLDYWFSTNNLTMNASKTDIIYYSANLKKDNLKIEFKNSTLTCVQSASLLGIIIDERLTWKQHIDQLAARISSFTFVLRVLQSEISLAVALQVYYAHVNSRISYGIILWGGSSEAVRILILQKKCLRSIFNVSRETSCRPLFQKYKILTVVEIYIIQCCLHIHNKRNSLLENSHTHEYNTRQDNLYIRQQYTHLSTIQKQFEFQATKIYNHLPGEIKRLSKRQFKKRMQKLRGRSIYSLEEYYHLSGEALWS